MQPFVLELVNFLKTPNLSGPIACPSKGRVFFKILVVYILGLVVISGINQLVNYTVLNLYGLDVGAQGSPVTTSLRDTFGAFVVPALMIFIPLSEELMFRLPLVNKTKYLSISVVAVIVFFILSIVVSNGDFGYRLLIVPLSTFLFIWICYYSQNARLVFYSSVIIFGLLHVANYNPLPVQLMPFYLIIALPQLYMGLLLGYARLTLGFAYAVLFHMLINTPMALVMWLV